MAKSHNPSQPSKQRGRGASRYKRSETARLLKAATDAGLTVRGIEADPVTGALRILVGKGGEGEPGDTDVEQWLSKHHAHKR
jgi:hypothetical protein